MSTTGLSAMVKNLGEAAKNISKNPTSLANFHQNDVKALRERMAEFSPKTDAGKTDKENALKVIDGVLDGSIAPENGDGGPKFPKPGAKGAKVAKTKEPKEPKPPRVKKENPFGYDTPKRQALVKFLAPLMTAGNFKSVDDLLESNPQIPEEHQKTIDAIKRRTEPRIWRFLNTDVLSEAGIKIEKPKKEKPAKTDEAAATTEAAKPANEQ